MATRNKILIRGNAREESSLFTVQTRPGMLLEIVAGGGVKPHATAGGVASMMFAREQHENQGGDVDDQIAAADYGTILFPELGAKINAVTSDTIARGDFVESDGAGGVRVYGSGYRIGQAVAASDLSGTVGRVEIIVNPIGA